MSGPRWWEGASIYHVYVRSWRDTDGDGFGDLAGVVEGLDHLRWLGVDALWLSPTMPSPDSDWGYDVSDYLDVHPGLGTLAGLDRLVADASARGLRVVLDLVPNHTSSEHAWFVESRSGRDSSRRDWYVWADPAVGGGPPNNWIDATGASAWTLDDGSGQYYLHNFLPTQPDLDWWNPAVRAEFEDILRFWLDRGVAGFRIDVAHALVKDAERRDDPPAPVGPETPFGLEPRYSKNRPEVHGIYRSWRRLADAYAPGRLLLGETWVLDASRLAAFYGADDELHLGFNFLFVFSPYDADVLAAVVDDTLAALPAGACPVWVGSNHDVSRFPTRWAAGDERRTRQALTLLCTLPGTVVLYYGDELGLTDVDVAPDRQRDPMSWHADDGRFNRDRARTPMPWEEGPGAGFTAASVEPWLPVGDRRGRSVAAQRRDDASTLLLTRRLLAARRAHLSPGVAPYERLDAPAGCWVYRCGPLVVAANLTDAPVAFDPPPGRPLLTSVADGAVVAGTLRPWEAVVTEVDPVADAP
jgi:alpha-glucosidase